MTSKFRFIFKPVEIKDRAIVYQKVGFKIIGEFIASWHPVPHYQIETRHVKIHETFLKGSIFEVVDTKVREAKPEVVIAQVYWKVTNIQKPGAETMKGIFTHTFVKNNNLWEIAATQNTLIAP